MFNFRSFVKTGFIEAVGQMPDYQIRLNAAGWHDKGVLTTDDLTEIEQAIVEKNESLENEETEGVE